MKKFLFILTAILLFQLNVFAEYISSDGRGGYYTPTGHVSSDGRDGFYTND